MNNCENIFIRGKRINRLCAITHKAFKCEGGLFMYGAAKTVLGFRSKLPTNYAVASPITPLSCPAYDILSLS
jgi:hypothetical protein